MVQVTGRNWWHTRNPQQLVSCELETLPHGQSNTLLGFIESRKNHQVSTVQRIKFLCVPTLGDQEAAQLIVNPGLTQFCGSFIGNRFEYFCS